jgi:glycosyltransferase involved in cell wall biosynthesis
MKVVYTAPNRGHHYRYASALEAGGILHKFVSGFSRFSPRAAFPEIGEKLVRADKLQTIYLASLKAKLPKSITSQLAYLAKIEQDRVASRYINEADVFLFYNGSGLHSCKKARGTRIITVAEAVNSHVHYQEQLLKNEYERLKLPWTPFHQAEKGRRMEEYELADYILLPSEFVRTSFLELGFPAEKLIKVPYGFNQLTTLDMNTGESKPKDTFTILYVGSISVRKGLHYLLTAFEKLKHPGKRLIIVGPESKPNGLEHCKIPDNVIFTGVLKGDELAKAYRSADVFCLPSIEEGLALVLGEALSFGLPIIATVNSGATDIITDGREGFVVPIQDGDNIMNKLQLLAEDLPAYQRMKAYASEKALSLNGWDATGRLLVESMHAIGNKKANA